MASRSASSSATRRSTYARERDLDLVEIAAEAKPPVCRVLDYSKYKYEQEQKRKAARKHQQQVTIREMKLRPKIATHDYETKKGHILRFLKQGDKVKVTIMFRGREMAHPERGEALLRKLAGRDRRVRHDRAAAHPGRAQHDDGDGAGPRRARTVAGHAGGEQPPATAAAGERQPERPTEPPAPESRQPRLQQGIAEAAPEQPASEPAYRSLAG